MMPSMVAEPEVNAAGVRVGHGLVVIERVAGRSVVTRDRATAPLKLLTPNRTGDAAWVYTSSYGGGLVAGDELTLDATLGPEAVGVLTTQASTKVYHRQSGRGARHVLHARVADGAVLVVAPDPLVCYADADYEQRQRFELAASGSLVLVDWLTCGRAAMGERWAFHRYHSRNDLVVNGRLAARDVISLSEDEGPLNDPFRTGDLHCLATVFVAGPRFGDDADVLSAAIGGKPIDRAGKLMVSASRMPWGLVMRAAGDTTERVAEWLEEMLTFTRPVIGSGLWDRKW